MSLRFGAGGGLEPPPAVYKVCADRLARAGQCGSRWSGRGSSLACNQGFGLVAVGGMTPRMTTEQVGGRTGWQRVLGPGAGSHPTERLARGLLRPRLLNLAGRTPTHPPCHVGFSYPVVADQMSVLPKVAGQSASGHGAGSASCPAASDAARYCCTAGQTAASRASVHTPTP